MSAFKYCITTEFIANIAVNFKFISFYLGFFKERIAVLGPELTENHCHS